jgi:hypothetical protein
MELRKGTEMLSWNEMSELEQAQCTHWDFYKEAFGFRPRHLDTSTWTLEDFDREFALLAKVCEQNRIEREAAEAQAAVRFEARITDLIQSGAKDRETAMRWIHEAEGTNGDDEYLCFTLGLPYRYFVK